jgi:hypothetical protein
LKALVAFSLSRKGLFLFEDAAARFSFIQFIIYIQKR